MNAFVACRHDHEAETTHASPFAICTDCGAVLMLDDKMGRIRVAVPNVMGYDDAAFPKASYHAFWDETKGYPAPKDGRPVYEGLRPDFVWPAGA